MKDQIRMQLLSSQTLQPHSCIRCSTRGENVKDHSSWIGCQLLFDNPEFCWIMLLQEGGQQRVWHHQTLQTAACRW